MIEISWSEEVNELLPEGGDAPVVYPGYLQLDIIETDTFDFAASHTAFAVEEGVPVSDNFSPEADRYTVTALISDRPIDTTKVAGATVTSVELPYGGTASMVVPPDGTARASDALEQLRLLVRNGTLVNVTGGRRELEGYVLESCSSPRTTDDAGALVSTLSFKEHRVAVLEDVDAPSPRVERGRRRTNQGTQTPAAAPAATTPVSQSAEDRAATQSVLVQGLEYWGI